MTGSKKIFPPMTSSSSTNNNNNRFAWLNHTASPTSLARALQEYATVPLLLKPPLMAEARRPDVWYLDIGKYYTTVAENHSSGLFSGGGPTTTHPLNTPTHPTPSWYNPPSIALSQSTYESKGVLTTNSPIHTVSNERFSIVRIINAEGVIRSNVTIPASVGATPTVVLEAFLQACLTPLPNLTLLTPSMMNTNSVTSRATSSSPTPQQWRPKYLALPCTKTLGVTTCHRLQLSWVKAFETLVKQYKLGIKLRLEYPPEESHLEQQQIINNNIPSAPHRDSGYSALEEGVIPHSKQPGQAPHTMMTTDGGWADEGGQEEVLKAPDSPAMGTKSAMRRRRTPGDHHGELSPTAKGVTWADGSNKSAAGSTATTTSTTAARARSASPSPPQHLTCTQLIWQLLLLVPLVKFLAVYLKLVQQGPVPVAGPKTRRSISMS